MSYISFKYNIILRIKKATGQSTSRDPSLKGIIYRDPIICMISVDWFLKPD